MVEFWDGFSTGMGYLGLIFLTVFVIAVIICGILAIMVNFDEIVSFVKEMVIFVVIILIASFGVYGLGTMGRQYLPIPSQLVSNLWRAL